MSVQPPKKRKYNEDETYTLHIDVAPKVLEKVEEIKSVEHAVKVAPPISQIARVEKKSWVKNFWHQKMPVEKQIKEVAAEVQESPPNPTKAPSAFRKIWDKLEFVIVSVVVFGVIYVVLNGPALYENALHYYDVWRGYESPLTQLTEETPEVAERLDAVNAQNTNGSAENSIPPLALEVYPPDMRIVIPRINKNVPVVGVRNENLIARRWEQLESDIQGALRSGVVHYPGTALPGENGNVVLTGHSSYYTWDPGRFKDVFALLHGVNIGDKVVVFFNQKKYIYQIVEKKVVLPEQVDVLGPTNSEQITLITCTPIGTNIKRLILIGSLIETSI